MAEISHKKRIWGWFFFDWASQPYNTLILTFIFGPYVKSIIGDGVEAQATWGLWVGYAGIAIALFAPILGAISDNSGKRVRWIALFSAMYFIGAWGIWYSDPNDFDLSFTLLFFVIGLVGMEFATIFTNSMLPDLGTPDEIGRISGNGWAFGYVGGLITLIIMLALFAENPDSGKTMIGLDPLFGLDASAREGTRAVGPLSAIWFAVFMIPFFLWVRDPKTSAASTAKVGAALRDLGRTIRRLPKTPSLSAYLGSSLLYRDALNGMFTFGGIYAAGVLEWKVVDVGIFGILAIITGAIFAWLGGRADEKYGPKPVITTSILVLAAVAIAVVFVSRQSVLGIPVGPDSILPDITFYIIGGFIGACGGTLQSASRTMMVRQGDPDRMTEAFGLYALAGKSTSWLAPFSIGIVTAVTGSQQLGITPLIVLFVLGLVLLHWVKPQGDFAK